MRNINFRFECLSIQDDWATFKLMSFEDDEVPQSRSFYFDILLEAFDHARNGLFKTDDEGALAVLDAAGYREKALSSPAAKHLAERHVFRHGYKVPITPEQMAEFFADPDAFNTKYAFGYQYPWQRVVHASREGDSCYAEVSPWKLGECIKGALMEVPKLEILSQAPLSDPYDYGVWAIVRFQVNRVNLLAHLVPGTIWNSDLLEQDEEHWTTYGY
jgi:hypothetical protein